MPEIASNEATVRAREIAPRQISHSAAVIAWLLCALLCFYQYAVRSSPGVMAAAMEPRIGLRYTIALVMGVASGAAMIPFSVVKEANPPQVKGSASGAMNLLCFMVTGLLSPVLQRQIMPTSGRGETLSGFQHGLLPLAFGIAVAIVLSFFLRETVHAASQSPSFWERKLRLLVAGSKFK